MEAPPERVWRVLADWGRYPEWMPDIAWVRMVRGPSSTTSPVGMELEVRTRLFGLVPAVTDRMRIEVWEPPVLLGIHHRGVVRGTAEWRLQPVGGGTRFLWREDVRLPIPLFGGVALAAYWPVQRWLFRRSLRALARLAESSPA